jgi:dihydroflavonol-4-reductase
VRQLLEKGYRVKAAVRSTDPKKLAPLEAMREANAALEMVPGCDVLGGPEAFAEAVRGCAAVFHTAAPFWMDDRITDPQKQLVDPAEIGTKNVLRACANEGSVKRVVLTSSFAAAMNVGGNEPWPADFHYNEEHWNVSSAPVDGVFPEPRNAHAYRWSKTLSEKVAWDFQDAKFDLVTIMPPMVLGENLQELSSPQELNQSSLILFKLLTGQMPHVMPGSVGFVNVGDVAKAHILAAESDSAPGQRYLCSGETRTWLHVAGELRRLFPQCEVPKTCPDGSTEQPCLLLENFKIRSELGIKFKPLAETLKEQGELFAKRGWL